MIPIFNADLEDDRAAVNKYLKSHIKAPYVYSEVSTLGGVARASAMVKVSLDPKENWYNGILQNSRYFMISIGRDGTLEQFSKSFQISAKLRKSQVKSLPDAVAKINRYIESAGIPVIRE